MSGVPGYNATIGDTLQSVLSSALNGAVEALATAISVWETARQSVRTVATGVAGAAMQSTLNRINAKYQEVPLTPAVLADMSIRNLGTESGIDLYTEASYSGINRQRFDALALDTGESYGIIDALRLWHRGQYLAGDYGITTDELKTVIYYSRVRDQFIPDLLKLSWDTMSGADALNTLVKGKASSEQARAWWAAAGNIPDQFDVLYESAGDGIGIEKATELWKHQLITTAQLEDIYGQSRMNPRFYPVAELTNAKWLPPYELKAAVAAGTVTIAQGTQWMVELGYSPDQASAFVQGAAIGTAHKAKSETEAIILAEWEAQIITQAEATTALESLGYLAPAIPFILEAVTARRVITMRNAAINRLRTAFIDHLVDEATARTELGSLGLPGVAIDQFFAAWTIEQMTNVKRLSAAQVGKLVEDGVLSADNAVTRWVQMGYLPEEAALLLYVYPAGSKAPAGTVPSVTGVPPAPQGG